MNVHDHLTKSQKDFHGVYWITVSHDYSIYNLQSKIAIAADIDLSTEDDQVLRAAKLSKLMQKIGNFILFLDDVWSYFPLENLGISDTSSKCKTVLTSRSLEICRRMGCNRNNCFKVYPLSRLEAWNLFMEKIGNEVDLSGEISQIAQSITEECAGLPLAVITMASSMRGVVDIHEWRDCLQMLKEAEEGPESMDLEVYPVLKFSYDRLKDRQLQQCLLYCAIYPEDDNILREEIISLFMDVGLIKEASRERQLDRGHTILNKLINVCLLETTKNKMCVTMHDLVRDMVLRIARSTFMVKSGLLLQEPPDAEEWTCDLEVVSLMGNRIKEITVAPKCPKLSTLVISENIHLESIKDCFFQCFPALKVLDLSCTPVTELPDSVANLVDLSALILQRCQRLVRVPSLAKLLSLRKLDLAFTAIKEVPDGMENLVNLKYLDLRCKQLKKLPVGTLAKLSKICWFLIYWPDGNVEVLEKGELGCLQKLEVFSVWFRGWLECATFCKSSLKPRTYNVIFGLSLVPMMESQSHVKIVTISGTYPRLGVTSVTPEDVERLQFYDVRFKKSLDEEFLLRESVGNLNYCSLKSLTITYCRGMQRLLRASYLLQGLQNLEELNVLWCSQLQEIITSEVEEAKMMRSKAAKRDEDTIITLPKLRHLELKHLFSLESICKTVLVCDSLQELEIWHCPKLKRIPLFLKSINGRLHPPSSLKHIRIREWKLHEAKEWWESLEWDVSEAKMALQPFVKFKAGY